MDPITAIHPPTQAGLNIGGKCSIPYKIKDMWTSSRAQITPASLFLMRNKPAIVRILWNASPSYPVETEPNILD
jgi:hypothetical protein